MSGEWEITTKENIPAISTGIVNNSGLLTVSDVINYGLVIFVGIQILYTLWKWRKEYLEDKRNKEKV